MYLKMIPLLRLLVTLIVACCFVPLGCHGVICASQLQLSVLHISTVKALAEPVLLERLVGVAHSSSL